MDIEAKLRPIYLMNILKERTDEDHYLTTSQLITILKNDYGIDTHRITIKSDIELLQQAGIGIQVVRSTQNKYNYIDRDFDVPELKLLIDAVMSAKFITKSKSNLLVNKLSTLAGKNKACELRRNLLINGRNKLGNEYILMIVDSINDAINKKKKIRFQTIEYNMNKERVLHNNGEIYTFSPYSLVWDGEFYYVVGYSDKYRSIGSHRVDRIFHRPEVLEDSAVPVPEGFDINKYINTTFHMYNAPFREVELVCENSVMDAIIDRFGFDIIIHKCSNKQNFCIKTEVAVGTVFFSWVFGFCGKVKINAPEDVKNQYKEMFLQAEVGL